MMLRSFNAQTVSELCALQLTACYYATKTRKFLVILGLEFKVSGKREARALAAELGARPWNF